MTVKPLNATVFYAYYEPRKPNGPVFSCRQSAGYRLSFASTNPPKVDLIWYMNSTCLISGALERRAVKNSRLLTSGDSENHA